MDVNDVLVFAKVAQAGSFSKAAKLLGMPVSTVSRRVSELEKQLGIPLLHRTTRSLKVTEVGRAYVEHGRAISAELEKAQAIATNLQSIPQGNLKVTATTDFGNQFLGAIVCEFLKANPRVKVDVVLTERVVDLIEEGFDLGIRIGELKDSSLLARKLGTLDLQLYASPSFLKSNGEPKSCLDLSRFECIRFTAEEEADTWELSNAKTNVKVKVSGSTSSNNMALIRDLAVAGKGIALMPHFMCVDDLKAGRLKIILKDWIHASGPIQVVNPSQRFLLPKVRAFIDHLLKSCQKIHWRYEEKPEK